MSRLVSAVILIVCSPVIAAASAAQTILITWSIKRSLREMERWTGR